MFCRKCGKEIEESSIFCPHCGIDTQGTEEKTNQTKKAPTIEGDKPKKPSRKWIIPVGVVVGIAVVATIGVLAMNLSKSEPLDKQMVTEQKATPKKQEEPKSNSEASTSKGGTENTVVEAAYPKEITLDSGVQVKLIEFIDFLCKLDSAESGKNFTTKKDIDENFASSFLVRSICFNIPFADGKAVEFAPNFSGWIIPEQTVTNYLQNSIGTTELSKDWIIVEDGNVKIEGVTPTCAYANDTPTIQKVTQISESDIQVKGNVNYTPEFTGEAYTADFTLTLTANPESMWGGYTLKEIIRWKKQMQPINLMKNGVNIQKLEFQANASSTLHEQGYDYGTENLSDLSPATCWVEGAKGTGDGETVTLLSDEVQNVSGIAILPGYHDSKEIFEKNGMPLEIEVTCMGKSWTKRFDNYIPNFENPTDAMVYIGFGETIDTKKCTVTITEGKAGYKYDDICISEMFLYKD